MFAPQTYWTYGHMSQGVTPMLPRIYMKGCSHKTASCPPGHEMLACRDGQDKDGGFCKQCSENTFQPNSNRAGDRCRLRKVCSKPWMLYKRGGSTTEDAHCKCKNGFHFENKDQRACVPNKDCDKGWGQGEYGVCIECIKNDMFSPTKDRFEKCKALTNCHKKGRCIVKKSNGTFDNICGRRVDDLSKCSELPPESPGKEKEQLSRGAIAGIVLGAVGVLVIIILLIMCYRRRRSRTAQRLSKEQLEEITSNIIKKSEKDEIYCRKVLSEYYGLIGNKIDRQRWNLAQELFRDHPQSAKYEVIVEKYKESPTKYAVNGYLKDWSDWKGESSQTIIDLNKCLKQCGREDIAYSICSSFQDPVIDEHSVGMDKNSKHQSFCYNFKPDIFCSKKNRELPEENKETTSKLLDTELGRKDAGQIYRDRPCPSAPVFDEHDKAIVVTEGGYKRTMSYPVQACS